jgi:biopolymer transport protein ExbD
MSHGSFEKCEPNFTPLLDLVLQLVMFFMICTNFVLDQTSDKISLPEAVAAKPLDKNRGEIIYMDVNKDGQVILPPAKAKPGRETLDNAIQVEGDMRDLARLEYRKQTGSGENPPKDWESETTLVLRIDKETRFEKSYPIIKACRDAGFRRQEYRAIVKTGN